MLRDKCGYENSVKDKLNILDYNQWSCGEYLNNLTGISKNNNNVIITSDVYSIGSKCLKLSPTLDRINAMGVTLSFAEGDIGKSITASADIKTNSINCRFQLRDESDTNSVLINLPNSDWANYNISSQITETTMIIYVFARANTTMEEIFLDNLKVTIT